jgi:hypothetical protein
MIAALPADEVFGRPVPRRARRRVEVENIARRA